MLCPKQERYQKYLPDEHPTVIRTLWRLAAEHKKIGQYVAPASICSQPFQDAVCRSDSLLTTFWKCAQEHEGDDQEDAVFPLATTAAASQ